MSYYIAINIIMFLSLFLFVFSLKKDTLDKLVLIFTLFFTQIVLTVVILGMIIKKLYPINLFLLNLVISIFLIGYVIYKKRGNYEDILINIKLYFRNFNFKKTPIFVYIIFAFCVAIILYRWLFAIAFPDVGHASLENHLPFISHAVSRGAITHFNNGSPWINYYPKYAEIIGLWNVIFIGKDYLIDTFQIFFLIYSCIITCALIELVARKSNLKLLGFLYVVIPAISMQASTGYIDIAISTMILASIYFLLMFFKRTSYKRFLFLCLSLSLLIGITYRGLIYLIATLSIAILYFIYRKYGNKKISKDYDILKYLGLGKDSNIYIKSKLKVSISFMTMIMVLTVTIVGLPFYIKNYQNYQNPVYPTSVKIQDNIIFKGDDAIRKESDVLNLNLSTKDFLNIYLGIATPGESFQNNYYTIDNPRSYGPIFICIFIPITLFYILFAVYQFLIRKRHIYIDILFLFLVFYFVTPSFWFTRYTFFIIALSIISLVVFLTKLKVRWYSPFYIILTIFVVANSLLSTYNYFSGYGEKQVEFLKNPKFYSYEDLNITTLEDSYNNIKIGEYINNNYSNKKIGIFGTTPSFEIYYNNSSNIIDIIGEKAQEEYEILIGVNGNEFTFLDTNYPYNYKETYKIAENIYSYSKILEEEKVNIEMGFDCDIAASSTNSELFSNNDISINGEKFEGEFNGFNVVAIDKDNTIHKTFDMALSDEIQNQFASFIKENKDKLIILTAITKNEINFNSNVIEGLSSLGNVELSTLKKYENFILVSAKGKIYVYNDSNNHIIKTIKVN